MHADGAGSACSVDISVHMNANISADISADTHPAAPLRLQIVPPGPGGVHDYAAALRAQWALEGCASELLALGQAAARAQPLAGVLMALLSSPQQRCSVLLHFSGYGFEKRGLCGWLLQELQAAQQLLGPRLRIVTLFHELFASSPPWQSAFWLGPLQARIARRLAALSTAVATNTAQHARWLQAQAGAAPVQERPVFVRPVFSNFPQPSRLPTLCEREPSVIVFGSVATRGRALRRLLAHSPGLQALGLQAVTEVGPGAPAAGTSFPWPHRHLGLLPPHEVSRQLLLHRYALIDYPAPYLAKSSVFAAYAAHGNAVLNTAAAASDADGLHAGQHYATPALSFSLSRPLPADASAWQAMADALNGWYGGHPLPLQARELSALLDPSEF